MPARVWFSVVALIAAGVLAHVVRAEVHQTRDVDGNIHDLFKPAGNGNVLVFVASDCPVSNGYAPEVQRICAAARDKGVACALVYEDPAIGESAVRAHRDQYRYRNMIAVIDRDRAISERAKARVTPEAVLVDRAGVIKYRGRIDNQYIALGKPRQLVTVHDLRDAIDAVLAGRAITHSETEAFGCFIPPRRYQP